MSPGPGRGRGGALDIGPRLDVVTREIAAAAERSGRDPGLVRIVAVSKGHGVDAVRAARSAGLLRFGENRVQEALPKIGAVADAEWHLVGHLQSNKARLAASSFAVIHSVDSVALLRRLATICHDTGSALCLLLQVNLTAAPTQHGFDAGWFAGQAQSRGELVRTLEEAGDGMVIGLMTMGPLDADLAGARATFGALRRLRDTLQQAWGQPLPELSMGMSADYQAAVAEGATLLRLGTALFGPR